MEPSKVIIVVICVLVLAFALYYFFNSSSVYSSLQNAQTMQTILASSLPSTQGTNYAYSIWIYINDWQTNIGQYKVVFGKNAVGSSTDSSSCGVFSDPSAWTKETAWPCPVVYLDEFENNLGVSLVVTDSSGNAALNSIVTDNIVPIQKWVFIAISVYQTILDVYIDGKLASTNILQGLPSLPPASTPPNLYITPCGGFNGWTSKLQFFSTPLNPQQVWDIYSQGYGGSYFSNDQNGVTITVNKNGIPQSSFSI